MTAPRPSPTVLDRHEVREGPVSALVLRCAGEIDSLNAHDLTVAVTDGLTHMTTTTTSAPPEQRLVVVDLRNVTFFGASAITALLLAASDTPTGSPALRLVVGDTRPVLLVVDALDLRTTFSIHHDLPDALHQPASSGRSGMLSTD